MTQQSHVQYNCCKTIINIIIWSVGFYWDISPVSVSCGLILSPPTIFTGLLRSWPSSRWSDRRSRRHHVVARESRHRGGWPHDPPRIPPVKADGRKPPIHFKLAELCRAAMGKICSWASSFSSIMMVTHPLVVWWPRNRLWREPKNQMLFLPSSHSISFYTMFLNPCKKIWSLNNAGHKHLGSMGGDFFSQAATRSRWRPWLPSLMHGLHQLQALWFLQALQASQMDPHMTLLLRNWNAPQLEKASEST